MIRKLRLQKLLPFLTLTILFVALWIASPYFMTAGNLSSIIRQTAVINIMALGMTVVIIAGGIDLSVGSMLGFASVLGTMPMENHPIWMGILAGIAAGAACGAANGAMVTALRINPFIVTLGTMGIFRGLALLVSKGVPINKVPVSMRYLADGDLLGVPFVLWILALCAVAIHVMLEHTRLGRYAFSIGSNADAAFYAGVPVAFVTMAVFAIGGLLTGLASMIGASRLMSGQPTGGESYELSAIAAVVIGGGSLRGGEGSVVGTLIGCFIMGLLSNGTDLLGINPHWQRVIIGAAIIIAVSIDTLQRRRAAV
jgi:ribose transport system permease protein